MRAFNGLVWEIASCISHICLKNYSVVKIFLIIPFFIFLLSYPDKKKSKCSVFDLPVLIIYIVKVLDYFRKQRSKITWLTFSLCFTMSMGKSEKFLGVEGVKKLNIKIDS